jgi:hypothetical protein
MTGRRMLLGQRPRRTCPRSSAIYCGQRSVGIGEAEAATTITTGTSFPLVDSQRNAILVSRARIRLVQEQWNRQNGLVPVLPTAACPLSPPVTATVATTQGAIIISHQAHRLAP